MLIALGAVGLRVRIHLSPRRWELENVHVVASTSSYRFRPSARLRAYSAFRFPGQPPTHHPSAPLLSIAWRNPRTASRRTPFLYRRCSRSLSLSQVWRPHEGHRKAHGCRDPTPVSTRVNHCCMKPLSPPRKLCVPRRAPHFSTSPPYRFPLQLLQRPSSRYFPAPTTSWPGGVKGCAPQRSLGTPHSSLLPPLEFA